MIQKVLRNLDYTIVAIVGLLIGVGLLEVFSTTHLKMANQPYYFLIRQLFAVILGVGGAVAVLSADYRISDRIAQFLYGLNIVLLVLVLTPLGREVNGARSWLFFFQPSEVSKIILIVSFAKYLTERESLSSYFDFIGPFIYFGLPAALIMMQPNLGTSLVIIFFSLIMMYAAGAPGRKILTITLAVFLGLGALFIGHQYSKRIPFPIKSYQLNRLTSFINPDKDTAGTGWQLRQGVIAIGSGQFFGKGLLKGTQGRLGYLPEDYTDFIFSVLCEELGFVGGFGVLFLFFSLIWRGIRIAYQARDIDGYLMAIGLVAMLLFHVMENAGMNMGIMPVAGIPLPFISFGGTAMVMNLVGVGILSNIWARHQKIMF